MLTFRRVVVGPRQFLRYSEHPTGSDVLFIPRGDIGDFCENLAKCPFKVRIIGYSAEAQYELEFTTSTVDRTLHPTDQEALEQIWSSCCQNEDACDKLQGFVQASGEIEGNFCHEFDQICDEEGRLTQLLLSSNELQCEFPTQALAKLTHLQRLFLSDNDISGDFQDVIDMSISTKDLKHLHLSDMNMNGELGCCPDSATDCLSHLKTLDLKRNHLSGSLPACLIDLPEIGVLDLKENKLSGSLPATLSPNPHMVVFDIRDQEGDGMQGRLPDFTPLESLAMLGLRNNSFSGPFPRLPSMLEVVHVNWNRLEGQLDVMVDSLERVWAFEARGNALTGPIPASLANSETLAILDISNNKLSGPIPEKWEAYDLRILFLNDNELTGPLPPGLADLKRLGGINLDNNKLTGTLNRFAGALGFNAIQQFSVANNFFTGAIPDRLLRLQALKGRMNARGGSSELVKIMDLSYNLFGGDFPEFLTTQAARLQNELGSAFVLNIQGNYISCPESEVKEGIEQVLLPEIFASSCEDASNGDLRAISGGPVSSDVLAVMMEHKAAAPKAAFEVEDEPEGGRGGIIGDGDYTDDDGGIGPDDTVIDDCLDGDIEGSSKCGSTKNVDLLETEPVLTEQKDSSSGFSGLSVAIIGGAVAGLIVLVVAAVLIGLFVIRPAMMKKRAAAYMEYNGDSAAERGLDPVASSTPDAVMLDSEAIPPPAYSAEPAVTSHVEMS